MNFKAAFIKQFINFILGPSMFTRVRGVIERLDDEDLSGEAKKQLALHEFKVIGLGLVGFMANFAVEIVVLYLRSLAGKV